MYAYCIYISNHISDITSHRITSHHITSHHITAWHIYLRTYTYILFHCVSLAHVFWILYIYISIYIYIHIHIHIYIYMFMYIYIFMYVCTRFYPTGVLRAPEAYSSGCAGLKLLLWRWPKSRCRGSRVSGDTYLYLYYIHICFHFCKYVYICVYVYIYIHTYIYIYR